MKILPPAKGCLNNRREIHPVFASEVDIASLEARYLAGWQSGLAYSAEVTWRGLNGDGVNQLRQLPENQYVLDNKTEDGPVTPTLHRTGYGA
jgi:hypothetical protein